MFFLLCHSRLVIFKHISTNIYFFAASFWSHFSCYFNNCPINGQCCDLTGCCKMGEEREEASMMSETKWNTEPILSAISITGEPESWYKLGKNLPPTFTPPPCPHCVLDTYEERVKLLIILFKWGCWVTLAAVMNKQEVPSFFPCFWWEESKQRELKAENELGEIKFGSGSQSWDEKGLTWNGTCSEMDSVMKYT